MARDKRENPKKSPTENAPNPERPANADDKEASNFSFKFERGSPKLLKKSSPATPYADIDLLVDFRFPRSDDLTIASHYDNLATLMDKIRASAKDNKSLGNWFNSMSKAMNNDRKSLLLLILLIKATVLGSTKDSIEGWEIPKEIPVPSQDFQEVKAIEGLFEEAVKKKNIKSIEDCLKDVQRENNREILINIALGNVGDSYMSLKKKMVKVV